MNTATMSRNPGVETMEVYTNGGTTPRKTGQDALSSQSDLFSQIVHPLHAAGLQTPGNKTQSVDDRAMAFIEHAEKRLTYHQSELIRLTCQGLNDVSALDAVQYLIDRAFRVADHNETSLDISDSFNDDIMDFVEHEAGHLTYVEAEIIRRAARGRDADTLQEIQYLINRARLVAHSDNEFDPESAAMAV